MGEYRWPPSNSSSTANQITLIGSDTDFATTINGLAGNDYDILVNDNIIITSQQTITKRVTWNHAYGKKIICATPVTSIIKFSDYVQIKYIDIEARENITNGIEFDSEALMNSGRITQSVAGKTLINAIKVNTGKVINASGVSYATDGTITNKYNDADLNSEIRMA